jgi:glycosyltransferase involved in cell wall biosynthesis
VILMEAKAIEPLVSVVIPVYNGSDYLRSAIDSALEQSYKKIEVIVVNDGSNDDGRTQQIIDSYGQKIVSISKLNGGVASALNEGITHANGVYIAWLSHDDMFVKGKVELQINRMLEHYMSGKKNIILYGDYLEVDKDSNPIRVHKLPYVSPTNFFEAIVSGYLFASLLRPISFSFHGCTTLIPKRAFLDYGLFRTDLRTTQDYDAWLRFIKSYEFIHMPDVLVISRTHPRQGSRTMQEIMKKEVDTLYSAAMDRYRKGTPYDLLKLGRVAFATRLDERRMSAYEKIRGLIRRDGIGFDESIYLWASIVWNPCLAKLYWKLVHFIEKYFGNDGLPETPF